VLIILSIFSCHTGKNEQMFCNDLNNFFSGNEFFQGAPEQFTIRHYAGVPFFSVGEFSIASRIHGIGCDLAC